MSSICWSWAAGPGEGAALPPLEFRDLSPQRAQVQSELVLGQQDAASVVGGRKGEGRERGGEGDEKGWRVYINEPLPVGTEVEPAGRGAVLAVFCCDVIRLFAPPPALLVVVRCVAHW